MLQTKAATGGLSFVVVVAKLKFIGILNFGVLAVICSEKLNKYV